MRKSSATTSRARPAGPGPSGTLKSTRTRTRRPASVGKVLEQGQAGERSVSPGRDVSAMVWSRRPGRAQDGGGPGRAEQHDQVDEPVGVSPLVVVPALHLDERGVVVDRHDHGEPGVEGARGRRCPRCRRTRWGPRCTRARLPAGRSCAAARKAAFTSATVTARGHQGGEVGDRPVHHRHPQGGAVEAALHGAAARAPWRWPRRTTPARCSGPPPGPGAGPRGGGRGGSGRWCRRAPSS